MAEVGRADIRSSDRLAEEWYDDLSQLPPHTTVSRTCSPSLFHSPSCESWTVKSRLQHEYIVFCFSLSVEREQEGADRSREVAVHSVKNAAYLSGAPSAWNTCALVCILAGALCCHCGGGCTAEERVLKSTVSAAGRECPRLPAEAKMPVKHHHIGATPESTHSLSRAQRSASRAHRPTTALALGQRCILADSTR